MQLKHIGFLCSLCIMEFWHFYNLCLNIPLTNASYIIPFFLLLYCSIIVRSKDIEMHPVRLNLQTFNCVLCRFFNPNEFPLETSPDLGLANYHRTILISLMMLVEYNQVRKNAYFWVTAFHIIIFSSFNH